ncbi:hypothetical protein M8J77_000156 [Diaphorina citri]|nr:hypothetical protein M8J77_000156 [Diaphorina citri]
MADDTKPNRLTNNRIISGGINPRSNPQTTGTTEDPAHSGQWIEGYEATCNTTGEIPMTSTTTPSNNLLIYIQRTVEVSSS